MQNETNRNIEYGDRLFTAKIVAGKKKYVYPKVVVIDINNFYFEGQKKIVEVYYIQNDEGIMLTHKIHIQISLPLLMRKWYTVGDEGLNELERTILIMAIKDHKKAIQLAEGDMVMMEYVNEIKEVEKKDTFLIESYDKEVSYREAIQNYYLEEGIEKGIEKERAKTIEIAKKLFLKGTSKEELIELFNLTTKEVQYLES